MNQVMDRERALDIVKEKVSNPNLRKHMIAVAAVMAKLADYLGHSIEKWELAGIVHDIDLGETKDPKRHGKLGVKWLEEWGFDQETCDAVLAHAGHSTNSSQMANALIASDQISGLITACALVKGGKLANVSPEMVRKRFKEKRFAAGADRESILKCRMLDLELEEFITMALRAMQNVSVTLGL